MISFDIKSPDRIGGLGVGSASLFQKVQMQRLGEFALNTVIERTKKGIGSEDAPMPPLKLGKVLRFDRRENGRAKLKNIGYAGWKAAHGLQPIRDLVGAGVGGHMLDNPSVRLATENTVRMAFTSRLARQKAITNEKRSPFFSFSNADQQKIFEYAEKIFETQVAAIRQITRRAA